MSKTVLVTGASSGIGKVTAKSLIGKGYTVYGAGRRIERMNDLKDLGCIPIKMDITKESDIQAAVNQIQTEHGGVDILINNAGFGLYGAMEDTTIDDARYQLEVNLFGLARLTQLVLPKMREQESGKIINVSSVGGKVYAPLGCWYHASKYALEGWSDCLRLELKPFNIDVVVIEPGGIKTEFSDVMMKPMLERSGNTAYSQLAHQFVDFTKASYEANQFSEPEVISDLIVQAIEAKQPKTRYVGGYLAKPLLFIRQLVSDHTFDWIIGKILG